MDLIPLITTPLAAATILRSVWLYIRNRKERTTKEIDSVRKSIISWLRRAVIHFVGATLKRQWQLRYALEKYTQTLYEQHEKLIVPGRNALSIDRCYVPLELRAGQMTEGIQLLDKSGAILLLGDPGTGKSALLSMLVRNLCRSMSENKDSARLPIYIPLQQLVPYLQFDLNDQLRPEDSIRIVSSWFQDFAVVPGGLFEAGDMVETFAKSNRNGVLFLLDGLDEVDREVIGKVELFVVSLIRYLAAAPGKNLTIIATRRQVLDFAPTLVSGKVANLVSVELKPFSTAAIYAFLLRYPYGPGIHSVEEARRIFSQLRLNPTLIETCSNPLALSLYVNHYLRLKELGRSNGLPQPETRAAFFGDVVDYLMVRTKVDHNSTVSTRPFRQSRTNFFVQAVVEHIRSAEPFNRISDELLTKHASAIARSGQTPRQALEDLAKDTGVIVENKDERTWRFIHRSFLDYFLACALASVAHQRAINELIHNLQKDPLRYLEGFYLACGLMASRNSIYLPHLLRDVGRSAFVGNYYPRAMLEAQAYYMNDFPERIRFYAKRWRAGQNDDNLLKDLASVLVDYELSCEALGQVPEVTMVGELGDQTRSAGVLVLQAAQLNLAIAVKLSRQEGTAEVLLGNSTEDSIVALYEPNVAQGIEQSEIDAHPRLAALVAETALRSSLLSGSLAPMNGRALMLRKPFTHPNEPWADTWPIRGSRFGKTLAVALPYVRTLPPQARSEFPHLSLLLYVKPTRHLRYEILFSDRRISAFMASIIFVGVLPLWLLGLYASGLILSGMAMAVLCFLIARWAVLRGIVVVPSCRVLNLQPIGVDFEPAVDSRVRLVVGGARDLPRWLLRRPRGAEGPETAIYYRAIPFVWRRFCPRLGDRRLALAAAAVLQQLWTEDVRRVLRG